MYGRSGGAALEGLLARMRRIFGYQSMLQAQLLSELASMRLAVTLSDAECLNVHA